MTVDRTVERDVDARPNAMRVDLDAVAHNVRALQGGLVGCGTFVAALKANAYGFGLEAVAPTVLAAGADLIAVAASTTPSPSARRRSWADPALCGARPAPRVLDAIVEHDLAVTVVDAADLEAYAGARRPVRALVKVDVGLARLGAEPPERAVARVARRIPDSRISCSRASTPTSTSRRAPPIDVGRLRRLVVPAICGRPGRAGQPPPSTSRSGSPPRAASLRLPDRMTLNGIDAGRLLYGLEPPGPAGDVELDLRPALDRAFDLSPHPGPAPQRDDFPGRVAHPHRPRPIDPRGDPDGGHRRAPRAVFRPGARPRAAGDGAGGVARARPARPLTGIDARAGDEVVVIGRQGDDEITPRDVATAKGLYGPAVTPVLIGRHVPRVYTD